MNSCDAQVYGGDDDESHEVIPLWVDCDKTFHFGYQMVASQGVNSTCFLGFNWHPDWKVLAYSKVSLNILRVNSLWTLNYKNINWSINIWQHAPNCRHEQTYSSLQNKYLYRFSRANLPLGHVMTQIFQIEQCKLSGDSWMYPYHHTPIENPYISPI